MGLKWGFTFFLGLKDQNPAPRDEREREIGKGTTWQKVGLWPDGSRMR